jgi:hypothetical protein
VWPSIWQFPTQIALLALSAGVLASQLALPLIRALDLEDHPAELTGAKAAALWAVGKFGEWGYMPFLKTLECCKRKSKPSGASGDQMGGQGQGRVADETGVTDEMVAEFAANNPEVRRLDLSDCPDLTDAAMKAVATQCTQICAIDLRGAEGISLTAMMDATSSCAGLVLAQIQTERTHLGMATACITDSPFSERLDLRGLTMNPGEWKGVLQQVSIKMLALRPGQLLLDDAALAFQQAWFADACDWITDRFLLATNFSSGLTSVDFTKSANLTDVGVRRLAAQCPQLQSVNLQQCDKVTDAGAQSLAQCPQLQSVNLQGCDKLTDAGVQGLAQCPQLQSVNLRRCGKVTDAGVESLAQCPQLQSVNLSYCDKVTDAGVQRLAQCPLLQSVELTQCEEVTDAGVESLAQCPQLQSVNLAGCAKVTDAGVQGLAQCPQLQSVNLGGCGKVTDAGKAALRQAGVEVRADEVSWR